MSFINLQSRCLHQVCSLRLARLLDGEVMPILRCYVDDVTMQILQREALRRDRGETPELLAENAIADAAMMSVPPQLREQLTGVREGVEIDRILNVREQS